MANAAAKDAFLKRGKTVRLTRAQRRAVFEKQIGHKLGVPKGTVKK